MNTSKHARDVEHFERWSSTYERSRFQQYLDRLHQMILDSAATDRKPERILDVGCGTGRLLRSAIARWPMAEAIGIDPAQGMLEVARGLSPVGDFVVGFAERLPLPDSSVDVALSCVSF